MSYEVAIVADSIGPNGARLTTFKLKYPRMIHSELMTHRMFSRNAGSSRAIPTAKMIEWVNNDPAMPVFWGKNKPGMQATKELPVTAQENAELEWLDARDDAIRAAEYLMKIGVHKQIASRLLEPFAHINVVVTATSFDNFFALRCDKNAMPEIQVLAVWMARNYRDSVPERLNAGEWHLPFVTTNDREQLNEIRRKIDCGFSDERMQAFVNEKSRLLKLSVARCARVSYETFDGKPPDPIKDIELHDQLETNGHWSPFEHQGQAFLSPIRSGNFVGWLQYRQTLKKGVHTSFDYSKLDEFTDRDFIV